MRQRHSMILTGLALIGAIAFGATEMAWAQVIGSFTATPTQISAGESVTFHPGT